MGGLRRKSVLERRHLLVNQETNEAGAIGEVAGRFNETNARTPREKYSVRPRLAK